MWVILGGAGHLAGSRLYEGVMRGWAAARTPESDRDFPAVLLDGRALPGVDNQGLADLDVAAPALAARVEAWRAMGVHEVWCACISAHHALGIQDQTFLNAALLSLRQLQTHTVGIIGSRSLYHSPWFQARLERAGLMSVWPSADRQRRIDQWVFSSMQGDPTPPHSLPEMLDELRASGANSIWLACTDLVRPPRLMDGDVYDSMELAVPQLMKRLRPEGGVLGPATR